ncbi:MAG: hypothetical protein AAF961_01020, partial [Planctomycetota bacterium]
MCNGENLRRHATRVSLLAVLAAGIVLGAGIASTAYAEVVFDSAGFESPLYSEGGLEGQNGWVYAPTGVPGNTAEIQGGEALGSQAVEVNRAARSDDRFFVPTSITPSAAQPYVDISWDMLVEQTSGADGTFGPYFAVEAVDFAGEVTGTLGSLGVDASTGDVLYQIEDTGFLSETGELVAFGAWNSFMMRLDYVAEQYTIFLNGSELLTTGFVDRARDLDNLSDAPIAALSAAGDPDSQSLTGRAYFDNYQIAV